MFSCQLNKMIYSYGNCFVKTSQLIRQGIIRNINACYMCSQVDAHKQIEIQNTSILPCYSKVDENYILKIINENSAVDLERFSLAKVRIKKLDQYRTKKGKFTNLEDVLDVDGFGIKVLEKFYNSILDARDDKGPIKNTLKDKKHLSFLTPNLSENLRKKVSNVISIHLSISTISWSVIVIENSNIVIKDCSLHDFTQENKRMTFSQVIELALNIVQLIPPGDIYVFEALQTNPASSFHPGKNFYTSVERIQLISMLSALLANRYYVKQNFYENKLPNEHGGLSHENFDNGQKNNGVYFIKNMLPARFFKTRVGNERISTKHIISGLFENSGKRLRNTEFREPLVLQPVMDLYDSLNSVHKELFGHALILGLTCVKLCILLDETSIGQLANKQ